MIRNPVLMLAWGLPAVAVVASVLSLLLTIRNPEGELPEQYHWEGFQLDRDFSQAARAAELHVRAKIEGFGADGRCTLALQTDAAAPDALKLLIAHATQPKLDQQVSLRRVQPEDRAPNAPTLFSGSCRAASDAHWRLELVDAPDGWSVRQSVRGSLNGATLDAVHGTSE